MSQVTNTNDQEQPEIKSDKPQEFCCWFFTALVKDGTVITKDNTDIINGKDQHFYDIHPKYIMWVENRDPMKSGFYWFNFCPNCGFRYETPERIAAWDQYWNYGKAQSK